MIGDDNALTAAAFNRSHGLDPIPLEVVVSVLYGLVSLSILLRLYLRGFVIKAIGIDDYFLISSWMVFTVYTGSIIFTVARSLDPGVLKDPLSFTKGVMIAEISYLFGMILIKYALAALYLRFVFDPWHRRLMFWTLGLYSLWWLVVLCVSTFQCGLPTPENFLNHGTCPLQWNVVGPVNYLGTALNAAVDWILTAIPITVLWKLSIPKVEKICVILLVTLGSSASVVAVIRVAFVDKLRNTGDVQYLRNIMVMGYISTLESAMAMIAMAISAYRPLWKKDASAFNHLGAPPYVNARLAGSPEVTQAPWPAVDLEPGVAMLDNVVVVTHSLHQHSDPVRKSKDGPAESPARLADEEEPCK